MITSLRQSFIIGLGGTGLSVVYALKRKYEKVFGTQRPPGTRFLVLDTTDYQPRGGVTLEPAEFLKLGVPNATAVLGTNASVQRWFPREPSIPMGVIASGAGQLRPLGRLALFHNAQSVRSKIRENIDAVRALRNDFEDGGVKINDSRILVQIIGSLSGGTGSGIFLDVAHICRQFLSQSTQPSDLVGTFLLPDIFVGKPATHNVEANAYAAFKELDHAMSMSVQDGYTYDFGGEQVQVNSAPFDLVYVVNSVNRRGLGFTDVNDIHTQISMAAYLSAGGVGNSTNDILDNLKALIGTTTFNGKRGVYASVGVSELVLDREALAEEMALEAALDALAATFEKTGEEDIEREVLDFLEANQLVEHEADQVIDALLPAGYVAQPPLDDVRSRGDLARLPGLVDTYRNNVQARARERLDVSRPDFESQARAALANRISARLNRPRGLQYSLMFLNRMMGRLEAFRGEMNQEANDFRKQIEAQRPQLDRILQEGKERGEKFFTTGGVVREIVSRLGDLLRSEGRHAVEAMRRTEAAAVYAVLIEDCRKEIERLEGFRDRLSIVERRLEQEAEDKRGRRSKDGAFRLTVAVPQPFRTLTLNSTSLVEWLDKTGRSVSGVLDWESGALADLLREFGHDLAEVKRVADLTIDEVLRGMSVEDRNRYMKALNDKAAPMWNYDDAVVNAIKPMQEVMLIGVRNIEEMPFDKTELGSYLEMASAPYFAEVGDPERIYLYKVELAGPGYAISGMHQYKYSFEQLRSNSPFHLEPSFESDPQRDLWPGADTNVGIRAWGLANASVFNLVQRNGAHYHVHSRSRGEVLNDYLFPLGQGRVRAGERLMAEGDLINEVLDKVQKVVNELGVTRVVEELRRHHAELAQAGKGSTDTAVKALIELELDTIDGYITELTTMT